MTAVLGLAAALLLRAAAKGAAVAAVVAAVVEAVVVDGNVNALAIAMLALVAKTCGRPFWWGAAAYGLAVVGLGSESVWPAVFFWGSGLLVESITKLLPQSREV